MSRHAFELADDVLAYVSMGGVARRESDSNVFLLCGCVVDGVETRLRVRANVR